MSWLIIDINTVNFDFIMLHCVTPPFQHFLVWFLKSEWEGYLGKNISRGYIFPMSPRQWSHGNCHHQLASALQIFLTPFIKIG